MYIKESVFALCQRFEEEKQLHIVLLNQIHGKYYMNLTVSCMHVCVGVWEYILQQSRQLRRCLFCDYGSLLKCLVEATDLESGAM